MVDEDATRYPIDGVLDLHEFRPQGLGSLVPEYLRACREEDIPAASPQSVAKSSSRSGPEAGASSACARGSGAQCG